MIGAHNPVARLQFHARHGGFTLVEVMVALTILSLVMLATVSGFRTLAQTQTTLDRTINRVDEIRTVSHFLRQVVESAIIGQDAGGLTLGSVGNSGSSFFDMNQSAIALKSAVMMGEGFGGTQYVRVAHEDSSIVLRWSSEPGQKLIELQSGNADAIDNPSVDDLPALEADENLELLPRGATNIFYLGMTNFFEPWSNQKIRQGVALGIDRQQIVDAFYPPGSKVPDFFTPCEIPFACEGDPWPAFDPEAGRALIAEGLEELGLEEFPEVPIRLRVVDRSYLPFPEQVAVELQNQLQENLGIPTVVEVKESGTFINDSQSGREEGFWLLGWNADYPEVTNFLDFHFGAGAGPSFGELWPEITEPLLVGSTSADPEVRAQAYTEANNAIREIVPMVPIATGNSFTA